MRATLLGPLLAAALSAAPHAETLAEYTDRVIAQSRALALAGRWDAASTMLERARVAARDGGPGAPSAEARLLAERGRVLADRNFFHRQDPAAARAALDEAAEAARAAGDARAAADVAHYLGQLDYSAAFTTGDWETPRAIYRKTLADREALGDRRGMAESLFGIGLTYEQAGRPDEARAHYVRSLGISDRLGDPVLQSYALRHLGGIHEERGELEAARRDIDRSLALRRQARFLTAIPFTLLQLAEFVEVHEGDRPRAMALLEEAVETAAQSGSDRSLTLAGQRLAALRREAGDAPGALAAAECARDAARRFGDAARAAEAEKTVAAIRATLR